jgi:hypothetical protein
MAELKGSPSERKPRYDPKSRYYKGAPSNRGHRG